MHRAWILGRLGLAYTIGTTETVIEREGDVLVGQDYILDCLALGVPEGAGCFPLVRATTASWARPHEGFRVDDSAGELKYRTDGTIFGYSISYVEFGAGPG